MRNAQHRYPATWRHFRLGEIADEAQLGTPERGHATGEPTVPLIKMGNLTWGGVNLQSLERVAFRHAASNDLLLRPGDILFNTRNTLELVGKSALWRDTFPEATFDNNINRIRLTKNALPEFVNLYMNFGIGKRRINALAVGSTSVAAIYWKDLQNLLVPLPPLPEQRKIAAILRTWDESIEKLSTLRKAKALQAGHLRQRLFEAEYANAHQLRRARDIFEAVSERARPDLPLLAVMQDIGIVRRDELDRRVAMPDGDTSAYKVVRPGDFVISLRSFEGGLEYSSVLGLVSPAYTVLRTKIEIHGGYYRHFFKSRSFIGRLDKLIFGIRDGKQIAFRDFGDMAIPAPSVPAQTRQTAVLDAAERELSLLDREIAALTRQKRGLMQKLLTGEWAVQPDLETADD